MQPDTWSILLEWITQEMRIDRGLAVLQKLPVLGIEAVPARDGNPVLVARRFEYFIKPFRHHAVGVDLHEVVTARDLRRRIDGRPHPFRGPPMQDDESWVVRQGRLGPIAIEHRDDFD